MAGINKVILVGYLGQDPEIRYTPDGVAIVNFSVATTESWKDKASGEKKDKTEWHRVVAFRKLGEICGEWLTKGQLVYLEGKLQTRSWEKDGITRYTTEIVLNDMKMLGSGRDRQQNQGGYNNNRPASKTTESGYNEPDIPAEEDDIPF